MTHAGSSTAVAARDQHSKGVRDVARKFAHYFLTAGAAAVVDAGGFALLYRLGVTTLPAAAASFALAAVVNFLLTSRFVFGKKATGRSFTLFLMAALLGLAVNVSVTVVVADVLGVPAVAAKIIGIGTAFTINFFLNLLVVFRNRDAP